MERNIKKFSFLLIVLASLIMGVADPSLFTDESKGSDSINVFDEQQSGLTYSDQLRGQSGNTIITLGQTFQNSSNMGSILSY